MPVQLALASLRATARRDVRREASRHEPLESESEPNELSADVESAIAALRPSSDGAGSDFLFRSKLLVAISLLPPDQRRVVELLLQETRSTQRRRVQTPSSKSLVARRKRCETDVTGRLRSSVRL